MGVLGLIILRLSKQDSGESPADYKKRMEDLFDEIEPGCGLLKFEHGEYNFWHLIFQEFLTATYLVDENVDSGDIVKMYWTDERYKEVIELYVGYLSIFNKGSANKIIGDVIAAADELPYQKWLLASQALLDVHKDRRNKDTLEGARNRLKSIISKGERPDVQVEAGETLGWLGDDRDLKSFVKIKDGEYVTSEGLVTLKGFEIGRYLVTNSWFEEFIAADGYKNRDFWSDEGKKWLDYTRAAHPRLWNERKWRCPNGPVVGVSWYEAFAFTQWLTITLKDGYTYHLPNEGAWEAAASGLERREHPWGNGWDKTKCNNEELKIGKTSPVGAFQKGNTPDAISDMAGNVWEWTVSDYHSRKMLEDFAFDEEVQKIFDEQNFEKYQALMIEKNRQLPVARGGSWGNGGGFCRCAFRNFGDPIVRHIGLGIRCARTLTL